MDLFGNKAQKLLAESQILIQEALLETKKDLATLKVAQNETIARVARLENELGEAKEAIASLRDSAIRGEIASGRKTTETARKFNISPARVSQIAPRRRYNNG